MPLRPSIGYIGASWIDARTLLANPEQKGAAKYIAVARRLLGEIAAVRGDAMTAEEELTRSLEPFATHPMPLELGKSRRAGAAAGSAEASGGRA